MEAYIKKNRWKKKSERGLEIDLTLINFYIFPVFMKDS